MPHGPLGDGRTVPAQRQPIQRLTLSKAEAAATLGVSVDFFDEHVALDLRIVRCGRRRLIPLGELERWIETNAARGV